MINTKNNSKKGLSLIEMLISTTLLALIMTCSAGFTTSFFEVSATSAKCLDNISQAREISQSIGDELSKADYIYPENVTISLYSYNHQSGANWDFTINTDSAVAMLFGEDLTGDGDYYYGFTAYFLKEDSNGATNLYQFVQSPVYEWTENTSPAENLTSFNGSVSKIISDINSANTELNYTLNYTDGVTDEILKGEISGAAVNSTNALIKGIDWSINQNNIENHTIRIKGLSRNVPRFI